LQEIQQVTSNSVANGKCVLSRKYENSLRSPTNERNESEKLKPLKRQKEKENRTAKVQIEAIKHCDHNQLISRRENPEKLLVPD
jgi:hypothetical protein